MWQLTSGASETAHITHHQLTCLMAPAAGPRGHQQVKAEKPNPSSSWVSYQWLTGQQQIPVTTGRCLDFVFLVDWKIEYSEQRHPPGGYLSWSSATRELNRMVGDGHFQMQSHTCPLKSVFCSDIVPNKHPNSHIHMDTDTHSLTSTQYTHTNTPFYCIYNSCLIFPF